MNESTGGLKPDWAYLAECLREARAGRPLEKVAALSGVSRAQIERYESGRAPARAIPGKLYKLAKFYGWPPGTIAAVLAGARPPRPGGAVAETLVELMSRLAAAERRIEAIEALLHPRH